MPPSLQDLSDKLDQATARIDSLSQYVDKLETVLSYHQHLGYDKSSSLDEANISSFITIPAFPSLPFFMTFGDGSDGVVSLSSGTTTLSRDMYYTNLTLSGTAKIVTAGWRIFVSGTLTISGTANIQYNGNTGGNGTNGGSLTGGVGGAALPGGSVPGGLAGSQGGQGKPVVSNTNGGTGLTGDAGINASPSIGAAGAQGGAGGAGGQAAGKPGGATSPGGLGGTVTAAKNLPRTIFAAYANSDQMPAFTLHMGSAGAGGGSGGSAGANAGVASAGGAGGGGGSGSTGGIVVVFAHTIVNSAVGGIQALGGTGGIGANALTGGASGGSSSGGSGGAGGGAGGTGGVIICVYNTLTQSGSGSFLVDGGVGGAGGAFSTGGGVSFQQGDPGVAGSTGNAGVIWLVNILT